MLSDAKYRFRVISNNVNCPIILSVDNHKMLVLASDGHSFEPYQV